MNINADSENFWIKNWQDQKPDGPWYPSANGMGECMPAHPQTGRWILADLTPNRGDTRDGYVIFVVYEGENNEFVKISMSLAVAFDVMSQV